MRYQTQTLYDYELKYYNVFSINTFSIITFASGYILTV